MSSLVLLGLFLRITQGIFAFLNIAMQSGSLPESAFIELSVIGNAILLSTFLDLGLGVGFIQNHFGNVRELSSNENTRVLKLLRTNLWTFIRVSVFQSFLVSIYTFVFFYLNAKTIHLELVLVIFAITFSFGIGASLSKILTARGLVTKSILYQFVGVFCQCFFTLLCFTANLNIYVFLSTLAIPNIVTAFLSVKLIKKESKSETIEVNNAIQHRTRLSFEIQLLQVMQFLFGTIPLMLYSKSSTAIFLGTNVVAWRIFTSVSSAMSSINFLQWRNLVIGKKKDHNLNQTSQLARTISIATILSMIIGVATFFSWDFLYSSSTGVDAGNLFLWILYVPSQVYQWHFYFDLLARQQYRNLIFASFLQLMITCGMLVLIQINHSGIFPLSVIVGVLLSSIYLQRACFMHNRGRNLID
jgi:hypothetical protein